MCLKCLVKNKLPQRAVSSILVSCCRICRDVCSVICSILTQKVWKGVWSVKILIHTVCTQRFADLTASSGVMGQCGDMAYTVKML